MPDLIALKGTAIYSYWATAEDDFFARQAARCCKSEKILESIFEFAHISLERTIKTDAVLAEQLVQRTSSPGGRDFRTPVQPGENAHRRSSR